MKSPIRYSSAALLFLLGMSVSFAQQQSPSAPDKPAEKPKEEKKPPTPEEKIVQTKHSLKIGGQEIEYTADARTNLLQLENGTHQARHLHVASTNVDFR